MNETAYDLRTNQVAELLNQSNLFEKTITTADVNKFANKFELNGTRINNKWLFSAEDVEDLLYRKENNFMTYLPRVSFEERMKIRGKRELFAEIQAEEKLFQMIVATISTLHPYALFNDQVRGFGDTSSAEGGIRFKGAAIAFRPGYVGPKTSIIPFHKQRLYYSVIVSETVNELVREFGEASGEDTKEKLINAGWKMVDNRISYEQYEEEINRIFYFSSWKSLFPQGMTQQQYYSMMRETP